MEDIKDGNQSEVIGIFRALSRDTVPRPQQFSHMKYQKILICSRDRNVLVRDWSVITELEGLGLMSLNGILQRKTKKRKRSGREDKKLIKNNTNILKEIKCVKCTKHTPREMPFKMKNISREDGAGFLIKIPCLQHSFLTQEGYGEKIQTKTVTNHPYIKYIYLRESCGSGCSLVMRSSPTNSVLLGNSNMEKIVNSKPGSSPQLKLWGSSTGVTPSYKKEKYNSLCFLRFLHNNFSEIADAAMTLDPTFAQWNPCVEMQKLYTDSRGGLNGPRSCS